MKISAVGIALIKEFEGFPNGGRPYLDPVGIWTIGYGHTEGVGPNSRRITEREASELLERDIGDKYGPHVRRLPTSAALNQNQFDALVSFIYNLGPGSISADTGIGAALRKKQWKRAADEMLRWNKANGRELPGLTRRRKAERALFLRPVAEDPLAALTPRERRWCEEYDRLLEFKRSGHDSAERRRRRVVLRRYIERQRKAIWRAAESTLHGWEMADRRARYRQLRARTT